MKTSKLHLLAISFLVGLSITACKKSDNTSNTLTGTEVTASQDAEAQDAQSDNVDQSVDNIADALEANNFSALKSTEVGGPTWTISSSDTTTFPKTITLTFATDTTINGETFKQTGTITIVVSLTQNKWPWRNYIKRTITFSNFKTENDSASFAVNGTRVMTRKEVSISPAITPNNFLTLTSLRLSVLDSIKSNMTFGITCGSFTGSFTRDVNRTRQAIAHFEKIASTRIWHQVYLKDTLIFKGSVTGTNLMDSTYSRVISENNPITFTRCALLVPVISSGELTITRDTPKGTKEAVITYQKEECKTLVTVTTSGGKIRQFERRVNRLYKKWW
ncbi:MAG TPA: hypothetical protein VIH57_06960 [Bacteroidales bacterium]